jgi:tRNA G18 (ribose-2'-O)-methylase SpoU
MTTDGGNLTMITGDGRKQALPSPVPVIAVLDRLRSAFNTGNVFRLAETTAISGIAACGYTPTPPHAKLEKTARGCDTRVPCEHFESSVAAIHELKRRGHRIYAIETVASAKPLWEVEFQFPAAVVFGNEALGIDPAALELCDEFIRLPCFGEKNSLNVGNCAGIVFYEILRQWLHSQGLDHLARTAPGPAEGE